MLTQISVTQNALAAAAQVITRNYLEPGNGGGPLIYDDPMPVTSRVR